MNLGGVAITSLWVLRDMRKIHRSGNSAKAVYASSARRAKASPARRLRPTPVPLVPNILGQPPSTGPQEEESERVAQQPKHDQERHGVPDVQRADALKVRLHVQVHGRVDRASPRRRVDDVEHLERVYAPEDQDDYKERPEQRYDQVPHPPKVVGPVRPGSLVNLLGDGL